jgi:hypothetical protein
MYAREGLFIAELVLWVPLLFFSSFVTFKHGLSRQMGWFSLTLLSLFRIIGAITGIIAIHNPSEGVIEAAFICASVGLISLIGALSGIMLRVNMNMQAHSIITAQAAKIIHMPSLAALIMSIIAGTEIGNGRPSDLEQAHEFFKISIGLITLTYLVIVAVTLHTARYKQDVLACEHIFVKVGLISIPIVAIRLVYAWLGAFLSASSVFDMAKESTGAVLVRAFMQVLEEVVVTVMFLWAGLKVENTTAPSRTALRGNRRPHLLESAFDAVAGRVHYRTEKV